MKVRHSFTLSNTFAKYFISYFIIFFIPFSFTYGVFNIHYINLYKQEIFANSNDQAVNMRNNFDFQFEQISSITKQVTLDSEFGIGFNQDELNRLSTVKKLNFYNAVNDFIYEIVFFEKGLDAAVSSQHVLHYNTMDQFYFRYAQMQAVDFKDYLFRIQSPAWRPFEKVDEAGSTQMQMLSYIYPFSFSSSGVRQLFLFQMEQKSFEKIIGMDNTRNINFIVDNTGNLIYSSVEDADKYQDYFKAISPDHPAQENEEENFFIASAVSEKSGWTFYTLLPLDHVLLRVSSMQKNFTILMTVLFLTGSVVVYVMTSVNYNPLKSLVQFIDRNWGSHAGAGNDLEKVRKALDYLGESNHIMKEKLENSSGLVKSGLLWNLLCHKFNNILDFNEEAKLFGISYRKPCFFIAAFSIENSGKLEEGYIEIELIEQLLQPCFDAYGLKNPNNQHLLFICSSENQDVLSLEAAFLQAVGELGTRLGLHAKVGISSFTLDISTLYRKHIEAIHALEYIPSDKERSLAVYGRDSVNYNMNYPNGEIKELRKALINFDIKAFNSIFLLLQNVIESSKWSLFMKTCICYEIINTIIKTLLTIEKDTHRILQKYNHILLHRNYSLDVLSEMLHSLCTDVTEYMSCAVHYEENSLIDSIKAYIEVHLLDQDFSLQKIADHFGLSLSNLSHYYKSNTGQVLLEYTTGLKMNYAKELLKNSDISLNDIMQSTGYTSMSSFIRKFKSHTGTTPGEYRAIFKNSSLS